MWLSHGRFWGVIRGLQAFVVSQVFRHGGRDLGHPQITAERGPSDTATRPDHCSGTIQLLSWVDICISVMQ